jgi:hypothetical protein
MKFEKRKFKLIVISLLLFTSIVFINSCKTKVLGINGKYTTANINLLDALILKAKFGGDFTYQIEMVLDLKEDSTFQIGFCQRKIAFVGNWKIEGDSVLLYNVFSYYSGKRVDSYKVYREPKDKKIFFPNKTKRIIKGKDTISTTYTVLKINGKGFDGILNKGFVKPLDSTAKN